MLQDIKSHVIHTWRRAHHSCNDICFIYCARNTSCPISCTEMSYPVASTNIGMHFIMQSNYFDDICKKKQLSNFMNGWISILSWNVLYNVKHRFRHLLEKIPLSSFMEWCIKSCRIRVLECTLLCKTSISTFARRKQQQPFYFMNQWVRSCPVD